MPLSSGLPPERPYPCPADGPALPDPETRVASLREPDAAENQRLGRDTAQCPLCTTWFSGAGVKDRLRRHIERHFQASSSLAPRFDGPLPSQSGVPADREMRVGLGGVVPVTFRLTPIEPKTFATYLSAACISLHPRLEGDWGRQQELCSRSCRFLISSTSPVEIFMRGVKTYPDLPGSVMRRIIR